MKKLEKALKLILGMTVVTWIPYIFSSKVLAEDSPQYAVSPRTQALYRYAEDTTEDSFSDCLSSEINTFKIIKEYLQFSDNSGPHSLPYEITYEMYLSKLDTLINQYEKTSLSAFHLYRHMLKYLRPETFEREYSDIEYQQMTNRFWVTKYAFKNAMARLENTSRQCLTTINDLVEIRSNIDPSIFKYTSGEINSVLYAQLQKRNHTFNYYTYNVHGTIARIVRGYKNYDKFLRYLSTQEQ